MALIGPLMTYLTRVAVGQQRPNVRHGSAGLEHGREMAVLTRVREVVGVRPAGHEDGGPRVCAFHARRKAEGLGLLEGPVERGSGIVLAARVRPEGEDAHGGQRGWRHRGLPLLPPLPGEQPVLRPHGEADAGHVVGAQQREVLRGQDRLRAQRALVRPQAELDDQRPELLGSRGVREKLLRQAAQRAPREEPAGHRALTHSGTRPLVPHPRYTPTRHRPPH